MIEGVSDALAGVARFGGGALADDPQRRRSVAVGGYTTTAVLSAGIGVCTTPLQVGILRAGAWTARGLRVPARNALLADIVPAEVYGKAYGFERAMDNLGAIVGRCSPSCLSARSGPAGPSGCPSSPACSRGWRSSTPSATPRGRPSSTANRPLRIRPVLQGRLGRLMLGVSAFEVGNCAATLLILRATELFGPGRQDVEVEPSRGMTETHGVAYANWQRVVDQFGPIIAEPCRRERVQTWCVAAEAAIYEALSR